MMLWLLLLLQVWASCLWLGHGEVVESFTSCPQFFYGNTPPAATMKPQNPAWICQTFKNQPFYATLYDINRRIPMYSAYIYKFGASKSVTPEWMVEPQLIRDNLPIEMETEETLEKIYSVSQKDIMQSQAVYQDYLHLKGLDRGQLNPVAHHDNQNSRDATFTLTNIVPMNTELNNGAWNRYEMEMMPKKSKDCQTTYAIVGAVPGNSSIAGGRVNVPSHIWSGACCTTNNNNTIAWAAIAQNDQNEIQQLTLGQLEDTLAKLYDRGVVSLFHVDCPRT